MKQTYSNIELIFVDDGSIDKSKEIFSEYLSQLKQKGIMVWIVEKENGGHSTALNAGFDKVHGKYLTWPDIDDCMDPNYINLLVNYFEKDHYNLMICKAVAVDAYTSNILGYYWKRMPRSRKKLVDKFINLDFEPSCYMVRTSKLFEFYKEKKIYDECGTLTGPQYQMLFPFIYEGNVGFSNKVVHTIYLHKKNHHSITMDTKQMEKKFKVIESIWNDLFTRIEMSPDEQTKYYRKVLCGINRQKLEYAIDSKNCSMLDEAISELKRNKSKYIVFEILQRKFMNNKLAYKCIKKFVQFHKGLEYLI